MKKVTLFVLACMCTTVLFAQKNKKTQEQEPAHFFHIAVWDYPLSDSFFAGIIPDTMRIVASYTLEQSPKPVYMLATAGQFEAIKRMFLDSLGRFKKPLTGGVVEGHVFLVAAFTDISYLSEKQIGKLPENKRAIAVALNKSKKYFMLSFVPEPIYGKRGVDGVPTIITNDAVEYPAKKPFHPSGVSDN
jgi:hypothetical protein